MASRDRNRPSSSSARYQPRPANYDKGPIFDWLQFSTTRLATTLLIRKQQVEAVLQNALETRLEPILEEDFKSCRVTQDVVEELTAAIDNTIKVLETRKRELFADLRMQYPGLEEPALQVEPKKSVEASTQTVLICDPGGGFIEDTDGRISSQGGPFRNKWVTANIQTDPVRVVSGTEERDVATSMDECFFKAIAPIEQACQTEPSGSETPHALPVRSRSRVETFERASDGSNIEICNCCGGAKITSNELGLSSDTMHATVTVTTEKQDEDNGQESTAAVPIIPIPSAFDQVDKSIITDTNQYEENSFIQTIETSGEPPSNNGATISQPSQLDILEKRNENAVIQNLVVCIDEKPPIPIKEELSPSNSNDASDLVSLEEGLSEHVNEFCGVLKECSVVMETMDPLILGTLRVQKYISLCLSDDDDEENSDDVRPKRSPKEEAEILLQRAVKSLERLNVGEDKISNGYPDAKTGRVKSKPPRDNLKEIFGRISDDDSDDGGEIVDEHSTEARHSVGEPGRLLNRLDPDLASDNDSSSDEEERNMENVLRSDSPAPVHKGNIHRERRTSTDSDKIRPGIPNDCLLRSLSDDDSDDVASPRIPQFIDQDMKSEGSDCSLVGPTQRSKKKKRLRMISSSDTDDELHRTSKRPKRGDERSSEEEVIEENLQHQPDVKPDIQLLKPEQGPLNLSQCWVDDEDVQEVSSQEPGRRNIRAIMSRSELRKATRQAENNEDRRLQRVAKRNAEIGELVQSGKLILDAKNGKHLVWVEESTTKLLKPHQKVGVKFMWDNCFESVEWYNKNKRGGGGCILAHCMGLGKTLQAITFSKTIMLSKLLDVSRILVLCPYNTLGNWEDELHHWLKDDIDEREIKIYRIQKKPKKPILPQVTEWHEGGGIAVMSFDSFKAALNKKKHPLGEGIALRRFLQRPGPDVVILDEGHYFKNEKTLLAGCVKLIRTKRRIILSGTPMQNNLKEYYNMVECVKPNLLGSIAEYRNMFVNPITNGLLKDSTENDVSVMRKRSHVLYKKVEGTVHRQDYKVLKSCLPPKLEYTILIRLTKLQEELYVKCTEFLKKTMTKGHILTIFHELCRVLSHPLAVSMKKEVDLKERKCSTSKNPTRDQHQAEMDEFNNMILNALTDESLMEKLKKSITNSGDGDGNSGGGIENSGQGIANSGGGINNSGERNVNTDEGNTTLLDAEAQPETPAIEPKWWEDMFKDISIDLMEHSSKMVVLMEFLRKCDEIRDKVIVFSQFQYSLDLIEKFLKESQQESWEKDRDYFRLDGNVSASQREKNNSRFNKSDRAKLYLISTKAGGHGINLIGANRVILFDTSFNPSTDLQCIYRIYRFGQTKPCFVYRLVARGALDQKMYWKQVVKLSMAERVVDNHGTARNVTSDNYRKGILEYLPEDMDHIPTLQPTIDGLLASILKSHGQHIHDYLEHDSLLAHCNDENLTADEQLAAVQEYERERLQNDSDLHLDGSQILESDMQIPDPYADVPAGTSAENQCNFGGFFPS